MAFDWVRRLFGASRQREIVELGRLGTIRQASDSEDLARRRAAQWLEASKSGDLNPPSDVHDAHGWDEYWQSNLRVGAVHQAFADMMSSDPELLPLLTHRGARSILCVGNGLSMEAASLGVAGFEVTALDVSAVAAAAVAGLLRQPDHPLQRIPGFHVREDDRLVEFGRASETPAVWPGLHHCPDHRRRDGGTLSFVTGDLSDPHSCPGPFDVVIERRTVQLFPENERIPALEALVARLSDRGVLVTHEHDGGWRPGQERAHYAAEWLAGNGFIDCSGGGRGGWDAPSRLSRLMFSTG